MNLSELLQKADSIFQAQDFEQAKSLYKETSEKAREQNDNSILVEAYSQIARCYLKSDDLEQCRLWLDKAKAIATTDNPAGWSRYLGVRGRLEWRQAAKDTGELNPVVDEARMTFEDMYDYCMKHNFHERAIDAAHMAAIVGNQQQRLDWGLKGIEAAEKGGIESWLPALWNNHGWNLSDAGRHEEALEALKKAREYHYKLGDDMSKLIADWSVGYAYRMVGQLDSAKTWILQVSEWANSLYAEDRSVAHAEWVGFAAKELGEIALAEANKGNALNHFKAAEKYLQIARMPEWDKAGFEEIISKIEVLESGK